MRPSTVEVGTGSYWSSSSNREFIPFDDGNICVQMRNLLVLFHVDSTFLTNLWLIRSVRHQSYCHCDLCHWSSDGVLVSLHLRGGESKIVVSIDELLVFLASICFNSFRVWYTKYVFMLTELNEVLERLKQGTSQS